AHRAAVEALQIVRSAHADRDAEHVREQAQRGERVEGTDRRTGGDDLDVVTRTVGTDRRDHFMADVLEELPLDPRLPAAVAFACEKHATVAAVHLVGLYIASTQHV